jgi:hypothetical protein
MISRIDAKITYSNIKTDSKFAQKGLRRWLLLYKYDDHREVCAMRPARFQFAFSCPKCRKAGILETVFLPHLSQSIVEIGYSYEPCPFRDGGHCLYWARAKACASQAPADVKTALSLQC